MSATIARHFASPAFDAMTVHHNEVRLASGVRFLVATNPDDRDDPVSDALRAGEYPLSRLFELLRRTVPAGARVVDLGGHVGSFALACAAAGYEVLCVEASPANAALIEASVRANAFTKLKLFNVAISDHAGSLRFHAQGPYGHVAPHGYDGETVEVEAITFDEVMKRAGWDRADFIKIDIEGSEVAALRGMKGTMGASPAPVLFCESNGHMLEKFGESPQSLKQALELLGLRVYAVGQDQLRPVRAQEPQGITVVDYLAADALPRALSGEVAAAAALTVIDHLRDLGVSARSPVLEQRWYAARALRQHRSFFEGQPEAERIRRQLVDDPASLVHDIARATPPIADLSPAPWFRRMLSRLLT